MIEKLEPYKNSKSSIDGYHWEWRPNLEDVINKVNEIIEFINANTADAKPAIRCKDCKFCDPSLISKDSYWCDYYDSKVEDDHYCLYWEEKEDG